MEERNISNLIDDFNSNENNKGLIKLYEHETFFDIIDKARSETVHSNFLKWIFNQEWSNFNPVFELLKCVQSRAKNKDPKKFPYVYKKNGTGEDNTGDSSLKSNFFKYLNSNKVEFELNKSGVEREFKTNGIKVGGKTGAVDIHIQGKIKSGSDYLPVRIVLENKIESKESPNQTKKYFAYFSGNLECLEEIKDVDIQKNRYKGPKNECDGEIQVFIFLTAHSNSEMKNLEENPSCEYFIHINYQDIMDNIIEPLFNSLKIDDGRKKIILEYILTIAFPTRDKYTTKIMALPDVISNQLRKFWTENKKTIEILLNAQLDNECTEEEARNLKKFWDENMGVIKASITALNDHIDSLDDTNSEVISNIKVGLEALEKTRNQNDKTLNISNNKKDTTSYFFSYQGKYFGPYQKNKLLYEVCRELVKKRLLKELLEREIKCFKSKKRNAILLEKDYKELIKKNESYDKDHRFESLSNDNNVSEIIYISNQWGIDNSDDAISRIKDWAKEFDVIIY